MNLLPWLMVAAFSFTANLLICGDELAAGDNNLFDWVGILLGFSSQCDLPGWVQFALSLLIIVPGLFLLTQVLGPLLANPIAGTIVAVAAIAGIIGAFVGLLN